MSATGCGKRGQTGRSTPVSPSTSVTPAMAEAAGVLRTTHEQVASELGGSREVISRLLEELEREGVVSLGRGTIAVLDPVAPSRRFR